MKYFLNPVNYKALRKMSRKALKLLRRIHRNDVITPRGRDE